MSVRSPGAAICPRAPVQMALVANLVLAGEKAPRQFETYEGGEASSWNGRMTFDDFAFSSSQGRHNPSSMRRIPSRRSASADSSMRRFGGVKLGSSAKSPSVSLRSA